MQECNKKDDVKVKNDDVKRTMQEWSAPEINKYTTSMYTEGKFYVTKSETSKGYGPS